MVQIVDLPDGTEAEFPDNMTAQQIEAVLQKQFPGQGAEPQPPGSQPEGAGGDSFQAIKQAAATALEPGSLLSDILGTGEALLTAATSVIAEPVAGLTGAGTTAITGDPEAGQAVVEGVREQFTFQPRTESGQEKIEAAGEFLAPVGEALQKAESFLGDKTFEATGSPTLAAAATTLPTAILELMGVKGTKTVQNLRKSRRLSKAGKEVDRLIGEAAPTVDQLKTTARGVFDEIDDLGATVKPQAFDQLSGSLGRTLTKEGLDPLIHPKASAAFQAFKRSVPESPTPGRTPAGFVPGPATPARPRIPVNLEKLETLRKVAVDAAADSTAAGQLSDARLANIMVDQIDSFMDGAGTNALNFPGGKPKNVGKSYKVARKLWGQARRSELLQDAIEVAREGQQASGFENGLRIKFRQILNNKRQKRFFSETEKDFMRRVTKGKGGAQLFKFLGKGGVDFTSPRGVLGSFASGTAGNFFAGPVGAVAMPVFGTVSAKLAEILTFKNARLADAVVRAGRDARKITESYIRNTPKNLRTAEGLAELLLVTGAKADKIPDNELARQAVRIIRERQAALAAAPVAGGAAQATAPEEETELQGAE